MSAKAVNRVVRIAIACFDARPSIFIDAIRKARVKVRERFVSGLKTEPER